MKTCVQVANLPGTTYIYGTGELVDGNGEILFGKNFADFQGIDDFRANVMNARGVILKEYRVFKLAESPVPSETQVRNMLRWYGAKGTSSIQIRILTAEEREAELEWAPDSDEEWDEANELEPTPADRAWKRPEFLPCFDHMILDRDWRDN